MSIARAIGCAQVDMVVTPGVACWYECIMCAHIDSLCVSDFSFYVYIHMPSQKAFRTDHIAPDRTIPTTVISLPDATLQ